MSPVVLTLLLGNTQGPDRQCVLHPGHPRLQPLLLVFPFLLLLLVCLLLFLLGLSLALLNVDVTQTVQPDCNYKIEG